MRDGSGAVSYYDAHFGLVLDKLEAIGKAQDTVVLVTGVSTAPSMPAVMLYWHTHDRPTSKT